MPGYVIHMALAETLLSKGLFPDESEANLFRLGSIMPDALTIGEPPVKFKSHFWNNTSLKHLKRTPDLQLFLAKYGSRLADPYVFGYYGHLFLDKHFVDDYWGRHFAFYDDAGEKTDIYDSIRLAKVIDTGRTYPLEEFFSLALYYGDYDRMNAAFARKYRVTYPKIPDGFVPPVDEVPLDATGETLSKMLMPITSAEAPPQVFSMEDLDNMIEEVARVLLTLFSSYQ